MSFKNLSKTFKYVNSNGGTLIFEYNHGYLINKPDGIDRVAINLSHEQSINQVGSTVNSKTVQPRPVTISGILVGDEQPERKEQLLAVVRPDIAGRLYADDYYLDVHVVATPTIESSPRFSHFQFSLIAPYPYWQKEAKTALDLHGVQKLFRFPVNLTKLYRFGTLQKMQFMNVVNDGQLPTPFTFTMLANDTVKNPKIINVTTGEELIINKTLIVAEKIVVETTHGVTNVVSSVDGNIRGALDLDSTFFRLTIGNNVLKLEAESGVDQLEVKVSFAPEITGVFV